MNPRTQYNSTPAIDPQGLTLVFVHLLREPQIGLNPAAPLAPVLVDSLQELLAPVHMAIHLDKLSLAPKTMVANLYKN